MKWGRYRTAVGGVRKRPRVLLSGRYKSGKSRLAAGFPHPILMLDSGEQGSQPFLRKDLGDECLTITGLKEFGEAFYDFVMENKFATVGVDSFTFWWQRIVEEAGVKFGDHEGRIPVNKWGQIKSPTTERIIKASMAAQCGIVLTAWRKELELDQEDSVPGMKAKSKPRKVSKAKIEGKIPYLYDYWYELDWLEDDEGHPNGYFTVEFVQGRVPPSVSWDELHPGKTWTLNGADNRSPDQVYAETIGWLDTHLARCEGLEPLVVGMDVEEARFELEGWLKEEDDKAFGEAMRLMLTAQTEDEYKVLFQTRLGTLAGQMSEANRAIFQRAHTAKRKAFEAKEKN